MCKDVAILHQVQWIQPTSQLSCLGSLVAKSVAWKANGHGFESHPNFSFKNDCIAMPFCCVVALPFSASLGVIVHAQYLVWGLVFCWFDYCGLLLNIKLEFNCLSGMLICIQDSAQPAELPGRLAGKSVPES